MSLDESQRLGAGVRYPHEDAIPAPGEAIEVPAPLPDGIFLEVAPGRDGQGQRVRAREPPRQQQPGSLETELDHDATRARWPAEGAACQRESQRGTGGHCRNSSHGGGGRCNGGGGATNSQSTTSLATSAAAVIALAPRGQVSA